MPISSIEVRSLIQITVWNVFVSSNGARTLHNFSIIAASSLMKSRMEQSFRRTVDIELGELKGQLAARDVSPALAYKPTCAVGHADLTHGVSEAKTPKIIPIKAANHVLFHVICAIFQISITTNVSNQKIFYAISKTVTIHWEPN